jgi:hypothetical protein
MTRFMMAFCIGIAATLAWQSYGDAAREMVANSSPAFIWLAPPAAPNARVATDQVTQAPATSSFDRQQLKAALLDLAATRQSVEQLAAQYQQMVGDIATMQAAQQTILRKVSSPPAPPPRQTAAPPAHNAVQN